MSRDDRADVYESADVTRDRVSTFQWVVIVVVLLLVLNFAIAWVFTRPYYEDEVPTEGYPWETPAEPIVISEDTTWTGLHQTLDRPVEVAPGATLRLEGSNISVDLLDLVFWQQPAIRVRAGGSLELVDSDLTITKDDPVDTLVVGDIWLREASVPNIARLVNLEGTVDPMVTFQYSFRYAPVPMAIGVLPEGGTTVEIISVFYSTASDGGEWMDVSAPLADYAGTQPWVVLFPAEFPEGLMFVSDLRVEDGGADPPGDWFPTGHPGKDGWDLRGFLDLGWIMESYENGSHSSSGLGGMWRGLVEADGNVTLTHSHLRAPADLPRRGAMDRVKESLDEDPAHSIIGTATRGGHVFVNGSRFTAHVSDFQNVPLLCNGSYLDVDGTRFIGGSDLLTAKECRGTLESSVFDFEQPPPGLPFRDADERLLWGLGMEGALEGYWTEVLNCTFRGCQEAIDLNNATVKLDGCDFEEVSRLGVWEHMSHLYNSQGRPHGSVEAVLASNGFHDCTGDLYLGSRKVYVGLKEPVGGDEIEVLDVTGPWYDIPLTTPMDRNLLSRMDLMMVVTVPTELVDADGRDYTQDSVWIMVTTTEGTLYPVLPPGEGLVVVDLAGDYPYPRSTMEPLELEGLLKSPDHASGEFRVTLSIDRAAFPNHLLSLRVDLDGGQEVARDLEEGSGEPVSVNLDLTFAPGLHELNAFLEGVPRNDPSADPVLLNEASFSIIRLEGDMRDLPPSTLFDADGILIESEAWAALGEISPGTAGDQWRLTFNGLDNSTVRIGSVLLPGGADLQLLLEGDIGLDVSRLSAGDVTVLNYYGYIDYGGFLPNITIGNASCRSLQVSITGSVRLWNVSTSDYLTVTASSGQDTIVSNCSINGWGARVVGATYNVLLDNCTVSSDQAGGVTIQRFGTFPVTVRNCVFQDAYLQVTRPSVLIDNLFDVLIEGNTFSGDGALLYVGFDLQAMTAYDLDPDQVPEVAGVIVGNTFEGDGSGVILHHGLFEGLYGANTLSDGARLQAFYVLTLRVMDTEGTPPRPEFAIIPTDVVDPSPPFPGTRYLKLEGEMLLDVTDDPSAEAHPPLVDVILYAGYWPDSVARGFASLDPLVDAGELKDATRVPFEVLLLEHVTNWPEPDV